MGFVVGLSGHLTTTTRLIHPYRSFTSVNYSRNCLPTCLIRGGVMGGTCTYSVGRNPLSGYHRITRRRNITNGVAYVLTPNLLKLGRDSTHRVTVYNVNNRLVTSVVTGYPFTGSGSIRFILGPVAHRRILHHQLYRDNFRVNESVVITRNERCCGIFRTDCANGVIERSRDCCFLNGVGSFSGERCFRRLLGFLRGGRGKGTSCSRIVSTVGRGL